jgi:hypothetical protein
MPVATLEKSYVELQNKVKFLLADALKRRLISIEELQAILIIFSRTETTYELEAFLEIFADSFPVLKQFEHEKRKTAKGKIEDRAREVVQKMIKKDPMKAAEIAKAALKPGVTWEELTARFPELEE